jgi:hypothetical protein
MFVIVRVQGTSYPPSEDREQLQKIADELNQDAIDNIDTGRWIVVPEELTNEFIPTPTDH